MQIVCLFGDVKPTYFSPEWSFEQLMGLCHGRTSALTHDHTDSPSRRGRTDDRLRTMTPLHLVACVTLTLSLLIPGNEAFAIPFNLFFPLDRTVQRVKTGYRPEVQYKTDYKLQKPSLIR